MRRKTSFCLFNFFSSPAKTSAGNFRLIPSHLTPGPRNNGHPFSFTLLRSPIERFPTLIGCYNINAIPVHFHFQLRILWRPRDLFRRMGTRDRHRASFPSSCGKPLAPPEALIFWAIAVVGIVIAELPYGNYDGALIPAVALLPQPSKPPSFWSFSFSCQGYR